MCACGVRPELHPPSRETRPRCDAAIDDPFRELEQLDDADVVAWMKRESRDTEAALSSLPDVEGFASALRAIGDVEADPIGVEIVRGSRRFLWGSDGRLRLASEGHPTRVLYDPQTTPFDGYNVINYIQPSWSGAHVVVSLTKEGEEISRLRVLDVDTGEPRPETISHAWPSDGGGVHWLPDDSGFVYLHYPVVDPRADGFLHDMTSVLYRLGEDPTVLHEVFSATQSPTLDIEAHDYPMVFIPGADSRYAVALVAGAASFSDHYLAPIESLHAGAPTWTRVARAQDKVAQLAILGDHLVALSARDTPRFQILATPVDAGGLEHADLWVDPPPGEVLTSMAVGAEGLVFATGRDGVVASLYHRAHGGTVRPLALPEAFGELRLGEDDWTPGSSATSDNMVTVRGGGWLSPRVRYRHRIGSDAFEIQGGPTAAFEDLVVEERSVTTPDGATVPLSLIRRRDVEAGPETPMLLYGYGAYGMTAVPVVFPPLLAWARRGGIAAVAHVRGGGERGTAWHEAGRKLTKPNTWRDLIACAEDLHAAGLGRPQQTAIWGRSAGGLMVGRAMTERPDLFGAVLADVGLLNPIRLEASANGDNSAKEFGNINDPEECQGLLEMDAYLHIDASAHYPPTLVATGIHDARVDPWMSTKFAARLQTAQGGPVRLWVDYAGGHGLDVTVEAARARTARLLAFAWEHTTAAAKTVPSASSTLGGVLNSTPARASSRRTGPTPESCGRSSRSASRWHGSV
ncbi:MAG: prolyl oligopeptidase family serine peptidase [Nannocystales bacterium]